jgi:hypothetical protein
MDELEDTRPPTLGENLKRAARDTKHRPSMAGGLAGIAIVILAAVVLYVVSPANDQPGIIRATFATVVAISAVTGAVFLWNLAAASSRNSLDREREHAAAQKTALDTLEQERQAVTPRAERPMIHAADSSNISVVGYEPQGGLLDLERSHDVRVNRDAAEGGYTRQRFTHETVRVGRLCEQSDPPNEIRGRVFDHCVLEGPGTIMLQDGTLTPPLHIDLPDDAPDDSWYLILPEGRALVGAAVFIDCQFIVCRFSNLLFTLTADDAKRLTPIVQRQPRLGSGQE